MKSTLYLCGAGNAEGVRLALRINQNNPRWEKIIILDDDKTKHGKEILGVKIEGSFDCLSEVDAANSEVANLVARSTQKRLSALQKIKMFGIPFAPLIDPTVDVWGVQYEDDITVYQNVTFSAGAFVDSSSVVFTGAVIGHGCKVGKCCVIAPGAVLNARVELGDGVYIGTNSSILPEIKIGDWATVGINSGVVQNIPAGATAMGVPAEILFSSPTKEVKHAELVDEKITEPENDIQKSIADIWAKTLKKDRISVKDNFFDVGGNSLCAVQIAFDINKALNVNLALYDFFKYPTIKDQSNLIEQKLMDSAGNMNLEKILNEIESMPNK